MHSAAGRGGATKGRTATAEEERSRSLRVLRGMGRGAEHGEGSDSVAEGSYGSEEFFMWVKMPVNNRGTVARPMPGDVIHLRHPKTSFSAACVVRASFFDGRTKTGRIGLCAFRRRPALFRHGEVRNGRTPQEALRESIQKDQRTVRLENKEWL
jgi:hypothetical protein